MLDTVLFVDDDEDLREVMQEILARLGVRRIVAAGSLSEVQLRRDDALQCQLAILDINLGTNQPSGVNVYEWLEREGFGGRIIFLTGHASNDPRVREAASLNHAHVASKPLSVAQLGGLIEAASPAP
jgi:DNA-binding NtrC family response regulator